MLRLSSCLASFAFPDFVFISKLEIKTNDYTDVMIKKIANVHNDDDFFGCFC